MNGAMNEIRGNTGGWDPNVRDVVDNQRVPKPDRMPQERAGGEGGRGGDMGDGQGQGDRGQEARRRIRSMAASITPDQARSQVEALVASGRVPRSHVDMVYRAAAAMLAS